jgi:hypothetical protein
LQALSYNELVRCRKCHYPLKELPQHRCPECGCEFDPADSTSFVTTFQILRQRRIYWISAISCLSIPLMALDLWVTPHLARHALWHTIATIAIGLVFISSCVAILLALRSKPK